jgi:hypothetical protein
MWDPSTTEQSIKTRVLLKRFVYIQCTSTIVTSLALASFVRGVGALAVYVFSFQNQQLIV